MIPGTDLKLSNGWTIKREPDGAWTMLRDRGPTQQLDRVRIHSLLDLDAFTAAAAALAKDILYCVEHSADAPVRIT